MSTDAHTIRTLDNPTHCAGFVNMVFHFVKIFKALGLSHFIISNNRVYSTTASNETANFNADLDIILKLQVLESEKLSKAMQPVANFIKQWWSVLFRGSIYLIDVQAFYDMYKLLEKAKTLNTITSIAFVKSSILAGGISNSVCNGFVVKCGSESVFVSDSTRYFKNNLPRITYDPATSFISSTLFENRYSNGNSLAPIWSQVVSAKDISDIYNSETPVDFKISSMSNGDSGCITLSKNVISKLQSTSPNTITVYKTLSKGLYIISITAVSDGLIVVSDFKGFLIKPI